MHRLLRPSYSWLFNLIGICCFLNANENFQNYSRINNPFNLLDQVENNAFITKKTLMVNPSDEYNKIALSINSPIPGDPTVEDWFKFIGNDPDCQIEPTVFCGEAGVQTVANPDTELNGWDLLTVEEASADQSLSVLGPKWTGQSNLLDRLHRNPSLVANNTDVQTFFDNAPNSSLGQFYELKTGMERLFFPDAELAEQLNELRAQIIALTTEMEEQNSILWNNTGSISDQAIAQAQWESLSQQAATISDQIMELEETEDALRVALVTTLLAQNEQIATTRIFETNRKTFNKIYLQTIGLANYSASSEQVASLQVISDQCPAIGGIAVLEARSLYKMLTGDSEKSYDDKSLCDDSSERYTTFSNSEPVNGQIVPNPSNDAFEFRLKSTQREPILLKIVDLTGKTIQSRFINSGETSATFNTDELHNGFYFLQIMGDQSPMIVEKIIISKH